MPELYRRACTKDGREQKKVVCRGLEAGREGAAARRAGRGATGWRKTWTRQVSSIYFKRDLCSGSYAVKGETEHLSRSNFDTDVSSKIPLRRAAADKSVKVKQDNGLRELKGIPFPSLTSESRKLSDFPENSVLRESFGTGSWVRGRVRRGARREGAISWRGISI